MEIKQFAKEKAPKEKKILSKSEMLELDLTEIDKKLKRLKK